MSARLQRAVVEEEARKWGFDLQGPGGSYSIVERHGDTGAYRVVAWLYSGTLAEAMSWLRGYGDGHMAGWRARHRDGGKP